MTQQLRQYQLIENNQTLIMLLSIRPNRVLKLYNQLTYLQSQNSIINYSLLIKNYKYLFKNIIFMLTNIYYIIDIIYSYINFIEHSEINNLKNIYIYIQ